ncbi:MAG: NusG domain II-containing protein [Agathobacter sp.]|nr:NusG domain II-containing protein [Agathobacter sp.]
MCRRFGKNDWLFVGGLLVICVFVLIGFRLWNSREGSQVTITRDGVIYKVCSLSENQSVDITDENGMVTNTLLIQNGKAKMIEADCRDQLCVHQKAISIQNENIVCLPNRVVVTVTNEEFGGFDGFVQ